MVSRNIASLSKYAYHSGRYQVRPPWGSNSDFQDEGEKADANFLCTGSGTGEGNWRRQVPGMFSTNTARTKECLRRSHPSCPLSATQDETQKIVQYSLRLSTVSANCNLISVINCPLVIGSLSVFVPFLNNTFYTKINCPKCKNLIMWKIL